jgi:DNA invertase Pin-like site-specific DNA recombinase
MTQKVMLTMFGLFAELERDLISERTKNGLARAKAEGKVLGNPNFQIDNKIRFENAKRFAEEKRTIIEALIEMGLTQRAIVDELNTQGITARRGGRWNLSQLQRVMKRSNLKATKGGSSSSRIFNRRKCRKRDGPLQ